MKRKIDTLENAFYKKYPKYYCVLTMWKEANGELPTWENITKATLTAFVDYLCEHKAQSSAKTYCAMFKSVLNTYSDQVELPRGWEKALSVKNDASQSVFLTEDELRRIIDYAPDTQTEAIVQQQFIVAALTGARHSDAVTFSERNVSGSHIVYVSQKTHIKAEIPLSPIAADILNLPFDGRTYRFAASKYAGAYLKTVSDPTFNATIRRICELCDINEEIRLYRRGEFVEGKKWEFVTSHTARKSFASIHDSRAADIYTISRMLGHNSVEMTAQKYIVCPIRELSDEIQGYFSNFS